MNQEETHEMNVEALATYKAAREAGASPKRAHTITTNRIAKLLGRVEGAWDFATLAQDAYEEK